MSKWIEIKLGDYIDLLTGFAFKSKNFSYDPNDIPLVKGSNVHQAFIDWKGAVRWSKEEYNQLEKFHLKVNDVVLAMDRPWIEAGLKYAWIRKESPKALLVQRVCRLRGKKDLSTRYLRYVIGSPQFTNYIKAVVTGVNIPHISGGQIKDYKFALPEKIYQERIADILEAYDNMIENNNRRIAILEEMAQKLYREWFVKFRFPGHEDVKMAESELGLIPEGWEVVKLSDIAKVNPESITARTAPKIIKYVDISSVGTGKIDNLKEMLFSEAPSRARRKVSHQDIIWATVRPNRKQYAYIVNPEENTIVSTGFAVIRAEKVPSSYLYFVVTTDNYVSYLVNNASGSAYPAVNAGEFNNSDIIKPTSELLQQYAEIVDPFLLLIRILSVKNRNLKKQRDLLLPKLILGKIDV